MRAAEVSQAATLAGMGNEGQGGRDARRAHVADFGAGQAGLVGLDRPTAGTVIVNGDSTRDSWSRISRRAPVRPRNRSLLIYLWGCTHAMPSVPGIESA